MTQIVKTLDGAGVLAWHEDGQDIAGLYPGHEVIHVPGPYNFGDPLPPVDLLAYAEQRYAVAEAAGTVWNGLPIRTDEKAQAKMQAELLALQLDIRQDGDPWEYGDGVLRPTLNDDLILVATAAREHVLAALGKLHGIKAQLGDTITTTAEIDAAFAEDTA